MFQVKQTPLHYAGGIPRGGMRWGYASRQLGSPHLLHKKIAFWAGMYIRLYLTMYFFGEEYKIDIDINILKLYNST